MKNNQEIPNEGTLISTGFERKLEYTRNGDIFECKISVLKELCNEDGFRKASFMPKKDEDRTLKTQDFLTYLHENNFTKQIMSI